MDTATRTSGARSSTSGTPRAGVLPFHRPPRFRPVIPQDDLRLPALPRPGEARSWRSATPALAASLLFAVIMASQMGASNTFAIASIFVASLLLPLSSTAADWLARREAYKRSVDAYCERLHDVIGALGKQRDQERDHRCALDPPVDELCTAVRARQMWERRPPHDDFLCVRWGKGQRRASAHATVESDPLDAPRTTIPDRLAALLRGLEEVTVINDAPLTVNLRALGSLGIIGQPEVAVSVLCQILAHHGPDDVRLAAFYPPSRAQQWAWIKWAPHSQSFATTVITDRLLACESGQQQRLSRLLREEITRRGRSRHENLGADDLADPHLVVLVDMGQAGDQVNDRGLVAQLLIQGPALDISTLFIAPTVEDLPADCRAVIEIRSDTTACLRITDPPQAGIVAVPDRANVQAAERLARVLSPLRITTDARAGKVPTQVQLLDLLEFDDAREGNVWAAWIQKQPAAHLRVPIGMDASGTVYLSLQSGATEGGPHGILGGMTGSGKSELLRSLVLAFAATHHPDRLAFVLVDYKGGSAFEGLHTLPHVAGYLTNLDEHLANRALQALNYELTYRMRLLMRYKQQTATSYQILRESTPSEGLAPLPNLLVVIDEFAELKESIPAFIDELVSIGRLGRSMGIHILLATQRPGGAINEDIRTNTDYTICLRVADGRDSTDVIGSPHASLIPRTIPGRGYIRVGLDPVREFQSALSTTTYVTRAQRYTESITKFCPDHDPEDAQEIARVQLHHGSTDLRELVEHIQAVATEKDLPSPRQLILPPLQPQLALSDVPGVAPMLEGSQVRWTWPDVPPDGWGSARLGLLDDPASQRQDAFILRLRDVNHVFLCGTPSSGKTTFLRTLAIVLAMTHRPEDLHLYGIDFGRAGLQSLAQLPHCGEIANAGDAERIVRLMADLRRLVEQRLVTFRREGTSTLAEYRRQTGQHLPYVVVLIDEFTMFHEFFAGDRPELAGHLAAALQTDLMALIREGHAFGVHFVFTDSTWRTLRWYPALVSALGQRLALRQADASDYGEVGLSLHENIAFPPGRGFASGTPPLEFQIALPVAYHPPAVEMDPAAHGHARTDDVLLGRMGSTYQRSALDALCSTIAAATQTRAPSIKMLPDCVTTQYLSPAVAAPPGGQPSLGWPLSIGVTDRMTEPFGTQFEQVRITLGGGHTWYLVAGPSGSGKTTLLFTILALLHSRYMKNTEQCLVVVAPRWSALSEQSYRCQLCPTATQVDESTIDVLTTALAKRQQALAQRQPVTPLVVVIDDLQEILTRDADYLQQLVELAKHHGQHGLTVIAAGLSRALSGYSVYDHEILRHMRGARTGILLCPETEDDGDLFGLSSLPLAGQYPPGRGLFISSGRDMRVQVAVLASDDKTG